MWEIAGYPLGPDGELSQGLIDEMLVYGDEDALAERARAAQAAGIDDIMVNLVPADDPVTEQATLLRLISGLSQQG